MANKEFFPPWDMEMSRMMGVDFDKKEEEPIPTPEQCFEVNEEMLPPIDPDIPEAEMTLPDTCLDALKAKEVLDFVVRLTGNPDFKFGEFKPCFIFHETMDWLEYLEEDCCTVTEYQKGSNIALLRKWDGKKYCGIVGIKVVGFSRIAPPEVVEAFKAYNARRLEAYRSPPVCIQCGKFPADLPSQLCPGCEAYQEHTK